MLIRSRAAAGRALVFVDISGASVLNPYTSPHSPSSGRATAVVRSGAENAYHAALLTLIAVLPPAVILISRLLVTEAEGIGIGSPLGLLFVLIPPVFVSVAWIVATVFHTQGKPLPRLLLALLIFPTLPHCLYLLPQSVSFLRLAAQPPGFPFSCWLLIDGVIWMCLSVVLPIVFGRLLWPIRVSVSDDQRTFGSQ